MSTVSFGPNPPTVSSNTKIEVEVVAAQFLYLAKLLLTAHDPSIPRIGPLMKSAQAEMNVSNRAIVLIVLHYRVTVVGDSRFVRADAVRYCTL